MVWENIENIRGPKGEKGDTGTISSASAESVAAGASAEVVMTGTADVKHAHFKVPRGLPGVNGVENDAAVAAYVTAGDSATKAALNVLYPVRRVWDGTAYPDRVPGAVNIFFGPFDPGLKMDPAMDFWANPAATTLPAVAAELLDSSSAVAVAARTAAGFSEINLEIGAPSNGTGGPMGNFGEGATVIYAWTLAKGGTNSVRFSGRIPPGWSKASLVAHWVREAGSGAVRMSLSYSIATGSGVVASNSVTETKATTGPFMAYTTRLDAFDAAGGGLISGSVTRLSDSAEDTSGGKVGVLAVTLTRIA